jgi:hypothetical protein
LKGRIASADGEERVHQGMMKLLEVLELELSVQPLDRLLMLVWRLERHFAKGYFAGTE